MRTVTYGEDIGRGYIGTSREYCKDWDDSDKHTVNLWYWCNRETPLVIHHGTKANEAINIFINDMRTKSLGIDSASVVTQGKCYVGIIGTIDDAINYALLTK